MAHARDARADALTPNDAQVGPGVQMLHRLFGVAARQRPIGLGLWRRNAEIDSLQRGSDLQLVGGTEHGNPLAFRSPGAATWDELATNPFKVDYLASRYSPMRRQIVAHPVHVTPQNLHELDGMQFVFLSVDDGPAKRTIVTHLSLLAWSQ